MKSYKTALINTKEENLLRVYPQNLIDELAAISELMPGVQTPENVDNGDLADVEILFSTWGMPILTPEQLDKMPKLEAVFYAAGAVDHFAPNLFERNIKIFSAWTANAIPVAEYCLAQILLSMKGFFRSAKEMKEHQQYTRKYVGPGVYGDTIALIGSGAVSQHLQKLLKPFNLNVMVVPSKQSERANMLEEAFSKAAVVSNHLPNRDDDTGVLNGKLFASMRPGAVFINTGRGRQVNEPELIEVLEKRPDLTALLDVTMPEPPLPDSKFYTLPNVWLTPHIAGSLNDEVKRMVVFMLDEFRRYINGEATEFGVDPCMLLSAKQN